MIGIILAAGFSKRMGKNKLLLPFKDNTIIESVIREVVSSKLNKVYIVCREDEVKDLAGKYSLNIIINKKAHEGQSTSIVEAIKKVDSEAGSYMFLMGDQPLINKDFINEMIDFYNNNNTSILVPYYNDKRGTPVIFSSKWKKDLLKLKGDEGGRQIIRGNIKDILKYKVDSKILGIDIDNIEDYERILKCIT